jgi:glutamine amidotransferase
MAADIVLIDYGMGNLWSVGSALDYLGGKPVISGDPARVTRADALILPGVGSFRQAMEVLRASGLAEAITEAVLGRQRKILGICLGMQLFAEYGSEDGFSQGLGFIPGGVDRFATDELGSLKVPHIGFNRVTISDQSRLFQGLKGPTDFYFVHSYRLLPANLPGQSSTCHYGVDFLAAYEYDNIFATQFHPEKSQTNGLLVLKNFLDC